MLKVSSLSKSFNYRKILDKLNFNLEIGETGIFMGKNGTGKTTLLRIIAKVMSPDQGEITFNNFNLLKGSPSVRQEILYLGHAPAMYSSLSALENLKFALKTRNSSLSESKIKNKLDKSDLIDQIDDPISIFPQGMLQRLKLAYAELSNWNLLLLDEPFSGLDSSGEDKMHEAITNWKRSEKTLCIVLHSKQKAEKYGDKIFYLKEGKITLP